VQVRLEGFEGPLDLLLDLARRQRVDLARISILTLVDQFVAAVAQMPRPNVARAADWLVMAAWLTWLKSRLLLPKDMEEARQGEQTGQVLIDRLAELEVVRSVAAWLDARPQLGRDMFERGHGQASAGQVVAADLAGLFRACVDVLRRPDSRDPGLYRPPLPRLWTPTQARERMLALLAAVPEAGDMLVFLPAIRDDAANRDLQVRGAVASTLVAGLELTREGATELRQDEPFKSIAVRARLPVQEERVAADCPASTEQAL
jgi:segregation and condensation protein A